MAITSKLLQKDKTAYHYTTICCINIPEIPTVKRTHTVSKNCDKTRNQSVLTLEINSACEIMEFCK